MKNILKNIMMMMSLIPRLIMGTMRSKSRVYFGGVGYTLGWQNISSNSPCDFCNIISLSWIVEHATELQKGTSILLVWSKFCVWNAGMHESVVYAYAWQDDLP